MKLRPVTYTVNEEKLNEALGNNHSAVNTDPDALRTGFIAQEVESAATNLGYEFSGVDKPKHDADFYSLRYAEFVVPLVKAIQEQQAIIAELQNELNKLRQKTSGQ